MTRAQIISHIQSCLESINSQAGFSTDPKELRRGIHLAEELNELPALTLFNEKVEAEDASVSTSQRLLTLHIWGAVHAAHDDFTEMDALAADCVKALADPALNPLWQETSLGAMEIYEGGANDPLGLFDLVITISYEAGLGEL